MTLVIPWVRLNLDIWQRVCAASRRQAVDLDIYLALVERGRL